MSPPFLTAAATSFSISGVAMSASAVFDPDASTDAERWNGAVSGFAPAPCAPSGVGVRGRVMDEALFERLGVRAGGIIGSAGACCVRARVGVPTLPGAIDPAGVVGRDSDSWVTGELRPDVVDSIFGGMALPVH